MTIDTVTALHHFCEVLGDICTVYSTSRFRADLQLDAAQEARSSGRDLFSKQAATDGGERQVTGHDTLRPQEEAENTAAAAAAAIARRSEQLNLACNDVVRTVLDGDVISEKARASALRQRLEALRDDLVVPDDEMSELFFENLLLVCQHELHPDIDRLRGEYGKAWRTILHYIEDAGWQLTDPPFSVTG